MVVPGTTVVLLENVWGNPSLEKSIDLEVNKTKIEFQYSNGTYWIQSS